MTVNEIITMNILKKLERAENDGTVFHWVKPFSFGAPELPCSFDNLKSYSGINRVLLDPDEYLTINKINEINKTTNSHYNLRKGSSSNIVVYFNKCEIKDENGNVVLNELTGMPETKGFLKYYRVYSRQDIVDENDRTLPSKFKIEHYDHSDASKNIVKKLNEFDNLIQNYCLKNHIKVEIINDGTQAFFSPSKNTIRFPSIENFKSIYDYIHTIAHEVIHSTMIPLNRMDLKKGENIEEYSFEELVAEIGAEMMIQNLKIPYDGISNKDNSLAYIQGWVEYLENKPKQIISAASKAEKASNFIFTFLDKQINKDRAVIEYER